MLIVRSSMNIEDDPTSSFAGAFESIRMRNPSPKTLWRAVTQVLASGFSRQAALRVLSSEVKLGEFIPGAIIQEWIEPKISGVCFSRDPMAPWSPSGLVEWTAQAGASVVQGEGRTQTCRQTETPPTEIAPFWNLLWEGALSAESGLGGAADLEWVWDGSQLWFVQLRPVATEEARLVAGCATTGVRWSRELSEERFPEPMTPLGWTVIEDTLEPNLSALDKHFGISPAGPQGMAANLRGWIYSDPDFFKFPGRVRVRWSRYLTPGRGHLRSLLGALFRFARASFRREPLARPLFNLDLSIALLKPQAIALREGWQAHLRRYVGRITDFNACTARRGGLPSRAMVLARMEELRALSLSFLEPDLAIFLVKDSLRKAIESLWGACGESAKSFPDLVAASTGNRTLEMGGEWQTLVTTLRQDPACDRFLAALAAEDSTPSKAGECLASPARHRWGSFIARNGHCRTTWDVALAGWAEKPSQLAAVLAASLSVRSRASTADPKDLRRSARTTLTHRLTTLGASFALPKIQGSLELLEDFMRMDEELHFLSGLLLDPSRALILRAGELLAKDQDLFETQDVFFLKLGELKSHLREGGPTLRFLARRRRSEWERSRALALPSEIPPRRPTAEIQEAPTTQATRATWTGTPVSPGIAIGPLHAATHLGDARDLPPGAVLITTSPNPALVPLYSAVGGLICSTGGILSHGFVAARELGLPAVSGVRDLVDETRHLGRWVRIDGTTGSIELLPEDYRP
jgi:pyruvate,water dikinase